MAVLRVGQAFRVLLLQCSSDISELRIRVLYARILRIRVCLYAYTRMSIRAF